MSTIKNTTRIIVEPKVSELVAEAKFRAAARRVRIEAAHGVVSKVKLPARPVVTGEREVTKYTGTTLGAFSTTHLNARAGDTFVVSDYENHKGQRVIIEAAVKRG